MKHNHGCATPAGTGCPTDIKGSNHFPGKKVGGADGSVHSKMSRGDHGSQNKTTKHSHTLPLHDEFYAHIK